MKKLRWLAGFWLTPCLIAATASVSLEQGYREMYNLDFDAAHKTIRAFEETSPQDPMGPASDAAAYLFFEFNQLHILSAEFLTSNSSFASHRQLDPDPAVKQQFETAMQRSHVLAEAELKATPDARDALLADVMCMALHADYLALIEKQNWQALNEIKQATASADYLLQKHKDCYDAYLAMGVENYLLSQKAAPVRLFLRWGGARTDKKEGMAQLKLVAEKGHYLRPYAKILLAIAALREGDKAQALELLKELAAQFPGNPLFRQEVVKLS